MRIENLSHEQRIALVALVEAMAISDGAISEGEERKIGQVAEALGDEAYRSLLDEAEQRFADREQLREFLKTVTDAAAQELIYGAVMEEAVTVPSVDHAASELLNWLKGAWDIRVEMGPDEASQTG